MSSDMADRDQRSQQKKRTSSSRSARPAPPNFDGWVRLASSGWYVRLIDVLDIPTVSQLASEDACWSFARDDWRDRAPRRGTRWLPGAERAEWRAEGTRIEEKRLRLLEQTRHVRTLRPSAKRGRRSKTA